MPRFACGWCKGEGKILDAGNHTAIWAVQLDLFDPAGREVIIGHMNDYPTCGFCHGLGHFNKPPHDIWVERLRAEGII